MLNFSFQYSTAELSQITGWIEPDKNNDYSNVGTSSAL